MIIRISIGVFLHSQELTSIFETLKEDRLFFRCQMAIEQGGTGGAESFLADKQTPDLLIVETTGNRDAIFQQLDGLANVCDPGTKVIVIGGENDIGFYRTLIEAGVSDYLVTPVEPQHIINSVSALFEGRDITDNPSRVVSFSSLTGGGGSSVLSHNVAHELSTLYDQEVILIDLDIPFGTAALNFNLQPRQSIADALMNISRIDDSFLDQYLLDFSEKLSILPSPASYSVGMKMSPEPLSALIKVAKQVSDFVVLDIPHEWDTWVSDTMAEADDVVLVAKPDLTNLRNGKNMVEYLQPKRGVEAPTRLVLNQVGAAKRSDLDDKSFKEALAMSPSIQVPYDPEAFGRALNNGEMMSKASAKSKATTEIIELAKLVSGREIVEEKQEKKKFSLFKKKKSD